MGKSDKDSDNKNEAENDDALPKQEGVVGGFAFYLSLLALLPTGIIFITLTFLRLGTADSTTTTTFIFSGLAGALIAHFTIAGHLSVFIHEFKHSLVSNLVGNRHKGMRIGKHSGHYQYSYTKDTAHYNAFVSMAPYIVPVFTFLGALLAGVFFRGDRTLAVLVVGIGYGIDTVLNIRDISPIQTDISLIRGGYKIGLLYITAWNLLTAGLVFAWAFHGGAGLMLLLQDLSACFLNLYISLFGDPRN